jgi:hypothetical protein
LYRCFLKNNKHQMNLNQYSIWWWNHQLLVNYLYYEWSDSLSQWKNRAWNDDLWSRILTIMVVRS